MQIDKRNLICGHPEPGRVQFLVPPIGCDRLFVAPIHCQYVATGIYRIGVVRREQRGVTVQGGQGVRQITLRRASIGEHVVGKRLPIIQAHNLFEKRLRFRPSRLTHSDEDKLQARSNFPRELAHRCLCHLLSLLHVPILCESSGLDYELLEPGQG